MACTHVRHCDDAVSFKYIYMGVFEPSRAEYWLFKLGSFKFISNTSRARVYHRAKYSVRAWLIYFSNEFELVHERLN
jgi:hypothetical protein